MKPMESSAIRGACQQAAEKLKTLNKMVKITTKSSVIDPRIRHILGCVREVLDGYEFKFTNILDAGGRCIHHTNRGAIHQLDRAMMRLGDEYEEIMNEPERRNP